MPSVKEFFFGTPEEVLAKATIQKLKTQQQLKPRDRRRLESAKTISRRLFIRQAVTIGAGTALTAAIGGNRLIAAITEQNKVNEEERFWAELGDRSNNEKVLRIDQFYSRNALTKEVAETKVVPVWLQHFIENGRSDIKPDEVLPRIHLIDEGYKDAEQKGGVHIDFVNRTIGDPRFRFHEFPSNAPKRQFTESAPGILFLRSIFTHEMGHFDSIFRDVSGLATLLRRFGVLRNPMDNPASALSHGFSIALVASEGTQQLFFANFDEAATDVRTAHISSKAGVQTVLSYETAFYLKNFLGWIGYDLDRFVDLHRSSDIEQLARDLGKKVIEIHKQTPDPDLEIMEGFKTIVSFNTADSESLEALFPGFKAAVLAKPLKIVV